MSSRQRDGKMATTACRECNGTVTEFADKCPHCGANHPAWSKVAYTLFKLFCFVGAVLIVGYILSEFGDTATKPPTHDDCTLLGMDCEKKE